jgi:hypothetical protein
MGYSKLDSNDSILVEFKGVDEECHRVFNVIKQLKTLLSPYKGKEMALAAFFESICDPNWPLSISKDNQYRLQIAKAFDDLIRSTKTKQWHMYKGEEMSDFERHEPCSFMTFKAYKDD